MLCYAHKQLFLNRNTRYIDLQFVFKINVFSIEYVAQNDVFDVKWNDSNKIHDKHVFSNEILAMASDQKYDGCFFFGIGYIHSTWIAKALDEEANIPQTTYLHNENILILLLNISIARGFLMQV